MTRSSCQLLCPLRHLYWFPLTIESNLISFILSWRSFSSISSHRTVVSFYSEQLQSLLPLYTHVISFFSMASFTQAPHVPLFWSVSSSSCQLQQKSCLLWEASPRGAPFSDTCFSNNDLEIWDLWVHPRNSEKEAQGVLALIFTPAATRAVLFSVWYIGILFKRVSCSPFW